MLPSGGYFKRLVCPEGKSGECHRPYCHYGGHSSCSTASAPATDVPATTAVLPADGSNSASSSTNSTNHHQSVVDSNDIDDEATTTTSKSLANDSEVPSYSTVPAEHFQGYHGFFASSSSPPPAVPKRPLLPTPPVGMACIVRQSPQQNVVRQRNITTNNNNNNQRPLRQKLATPRQQAHDQHNHITNSKPQRESNLNDLARDLAAINNEIERLQRKIQSGGSADEQTDMNAADDCEAVMGDEECSLDAVPAYDPEMPDAKRVRFNSNQGGFDSASSANNGTDSSSDEQQYHPKAIAKTTPGTKSPYKPTPIDELHKLGKAQNKLLKNSWKPPADDEAPKLPKAATKPNKKLISTTTSQQNNSKATALSSSKSAALLTEKKKKDSSSSSVLDLFGDDSDGGNGNGSTTATGNERQRKQLLSKGGNISASFTKSSSKSKAGDPEADMASIIDDFVAPTAATAKRKQATPAAASGGKKSSTNIAGSGDETKKKRVAHVADSSTDAAAKKLREVGGERPRGHVMSARQQLEARFAQLKKMEEEIQAKREALNNEAKMEQQDAKHPPPKQPPVRIDHAASSASSNNKQAGEIGTNPKGEKRKARLPKPTDQPKQSSGRPTIALEVGAKVPTNVRQQYLNLIVDEYLKFLAETDAYKKALEEERAVYAKAASKGGYLNAVVNVIKRIRDDGGSSVATAAPTSGKKKPTSGVSHSAVIGGKPATKASYTIGRSGGGAATADSVSRERRRASALSGEDFYEYMSQFILTIDQQAANGYPRPDLDKPGCAVYYKEEIKKMYIDDNDLKRICTRCGKRYQLSPDSEYISRDDCVFHWGRAWKKKVAGTVESRYNCCQGDLNSAGCSLSQYHVSDCVPRRALSGYAYTKDWRNGNEESKCKAVFALDCEMVYTTFGNELARVTVVDDQCNVVYERLVRPENTILDYNTRFSGLTEELLMKSNANVINLDDVHADLAGLFTEDTILIGHSLESDFRAMKLIHDKVVDTSIVFPHRLGSPYKRALKTLAVEFLKRIIQDDFDGHDSKQDAVTCMDLMKWRVKQDVGRLKF